MRLSCFCRLLGVGGLAVLGTLGSGPGAGNGIGLLLVGRE
jgi:hypothetical protein